MRLLTYLELSRYSKAELWDLYRHNVAMLPGLRAGSVDHYNATLNIHHIRMFLARPSYTPL